MTGDGTKVRIVPCLWFDNQAEEAARFYTSVFANSRITRITRYPEEGQEIHGKLAGSVMTVDFELDGRSLTALNGGPHFKFNEAISLQILCETQEEVDYFWQELGADGEYQQCGWLKDKYGLSWQVVPSLSLDLFDDHHSEKARRAMKAMMAMQKIDIETLRQASEKSSV